LPFRRDLEGSALAGAEPLQRVLRPDAVHRDERIVIERRHSLIGDRHLRAARARPELRDPEPIAAREAGLADPVDLAILRLVAADHERDMKLLRRLLEGNAVGTAGRERFLLVVIGVVAELAAGRSAQITVAAEERPVRFILLRMLLAQEGVVEGPERQ